MRGSATVPVMLYTSEPATEFFACAIVKSSACPNDAVPLTSYVPEGETSAAFSISIFPSLQAGPTLPARNSQRSFAIRQRNVSQCPVLHIETNATLGRSPELSRIRS